MKDSSVEWFFGIDRMMDFSGSRVLELEALVCLKMVDLDFGKRPPSTSSCPVLVQGLGCRIG